MKLSIIIINWNSVGYLKKCLNSIFSQTNGIKYEVIVLDNGSYDGCSEVLDNEFPEVHFIQNKNNSGFAHANNMAAQYSNGNVLLFLNPDTIIIGNALKTLYETFISIKNAGAVGARLLNSDGSFQSSCVQTFPSISKMLLDSELLRKLFPNLKIWGPKPIFDGGKKPIRVEGISGASLMTHKQLFKIVGGFDEDYFMYYEDMDYCYKINREGWSNYLVQNATIIHHGGKSSGGTYSRFSNVTMAESGLIYFRKWRGVWYARIFQLCMTVKAALCVCLLAGTYLKNTSELKIERTREALKKWKFILAWCFKTKL